MIKSISYLSLPRCSGNTLFVAMFALAGRGKQAGHTGSLGNIFGSSSKVTKKEDKEKRKR